MIKVPVYLTHSYACSYLESKAAKSILVDTEFCLNVENYAELMAQGFRRSGNQVYRPYCQSCQSCIPTRLVVEAFRPNRQQQRCLKQNVETRVVIKPAAFDEQQFFLYQQYQLARHAQPSVEQLVCETEYLQFLTSSWCETWFVEFIINDKLAAVAVVDVVPQALSAVYTFFAPEFAAHSPGVYAVLWQIEQAKQLGLDYVYLGFWVKNCRKMQYKIQYQPLFGLIDQQWQPLLKES